MEPSDIPYASDPSPSPRRSYWLRLGGGSLTISLILHGVVLALGVFWILQVIPPEPVVKFAPGGGSRGNATAIPSQKKQQHLTRARAPRLAAQGVASELSLPEPDLSSRMGKLEALSGRGMMNSLNGGDGAKGNTAGGLGNSMLQGGNPGSGPSLFGSPNPVQRVA